MKMQVRWRDNNGKVAQSQIHLNPSLSLDAAVNFSLTAANLMEQLSDAYATDVRIIREVEYAAGQPSNFLNSDVFSRLLLFFRNGERHSFVRIPAARASLPYDTSGSYRGHRITNSSFYSSAIMAATIPLWESVVGPDGTPLAGQFVVGCRTRETQ